MNKASFIELVADKAQLSRAAAARAVDAIFNTASGAITEAVDAAGQLSIPGFGKFSRRTRAARTGRNPRTGAVIHVPERTSIAFTPGRGLRNLSAAEATARPAAKKSTKKSAAAQGATPRKSPAKKAATTKATGAAAARAQKSK